jgi:N-acetylneuraminic acid mutarotase
VCCPAGRLVFERVGSLILGLALLAIANGVSSAEATWERLASLPVPNGGFVAGELDGRVVVAGGVTWRDDVKIWLDGIWLYDPGRNTWSESGRLSAPLAYSVFGVAEGSLWFAGGSSGQSTNQTLWRMDAAHRPRSVARFAPGFVYAAGGVIGTTLYAVGGSDDQAHVERATNNFIAIDSQTGETKRLPDYPEPSLITAAAAVAGDRLFVFGGARWDAVKKAVVNHSSAHVYSPARNRWEQLPPLPHPGRGCTAITLDADHILIVGGYRNDEVEFVADAFLFNSRSRTYRPTVPLPYAAMVTLVKSGEWLYCLGGEDRKRHRSDAVFRIRWRLLLGSSQPGNADKG